MASAYVCCALKQIARRCRLRKQYTQPASGEQLARFTQKLHACRGHARAQTQHFRTHHKALTNAWAHIVHAQVNGANTAKAFHALLPWLCHVLGTQGGHDGYATHRVQRRADGTAVDAVDGRVPHQIWLHLHAG